MAFVLDASVALAWCFPDEANDHADTVLRRFVEDDAVVPAIWPLEVLNALFVGARRGRIREHEIERAGRLLGNLAIDVDEPILFRTFDTIREVAQTTQLTAYDAAYVELALRLRCALATTDAKLSASARALGIDVL